MFASKTSQRQKMLPKGKELKAIGKVSNNNPGPEETERIGLLYTIGKIVNPANNATEVSKIIIRTILVHIYKINPYFY